MRIPTLAVTLAAATALVALPTTASAAAPAALADSAQTQLATKVTVNVLANDTVDDGKSKTLTAPLTVTDTAHGKVTCAADGSCDYTPNAGHTGSDQFTYTVSDGTLTSSGTATVTTFNVDAVANLITLAGGTTSASSVRWPDQKLNIATVVKDPSGTVLEGVKATLLATPSGGEETVIATGTTNASGRISVSNLQPTTRTSYKWKTAPGRSSAARSVGVTPALSAAYEAKSLSLGDTSTISGTSMPADAGQLVVLERLTSTGTWVVAQETEFLASSTPTAGAPYSFTLEPAASRVDTYRVKVLAGETGRNEATTTATKVRTYQADITKVVPGTGAEPDEFVTVANIGKVGFNLDDWVLSGGLNNLRLPKRSVAAGTFVRIHTGSGRNTTKDLFLGRAKVWDNTEGTVTLKDANAHVIEAYAYPAVP